MGIFNRPSALPNLDDTRAPASSAVDSQKSVADRVASSSGDFSIESMSLEYDEELSTSMNRDSDYYGAEKNTLQQGFLTDTFFPFPIGGFC